MAPLYHQECGSEADVYEKEPQFGNKTRSFLFYLTPQFSMIAFATAIEPLRVANRILGHKAYTWKLVSLDGQPVKASNFVEVNVDCALTDIRSTCLTSEKPGMILVCSGLNVERHVNKTVNGWLRECHNHGIAIGGLCTATYILASAGLLAGKRCAIHWENIAGFAEAFPRVDVHADLFEKDGNIYTCAGGTASLDMMLALINEDFGEGIVNGVCEQALTDRVRNPHDRQRLPLRARLGVQNSKILTTIELMESNIAEPLSLVDIANHIGLSRRQIERLFNQHMGRSPARYYLEIRLDRARHLLMQSNLPIIETAVACGFISASHFSKCYRELYGRSPQQERTSNRQTQLDEIAAEGEPS